MSVKTYAFIDSQNLNLGVKSQGWKLDFSKFRIFIRDKYKVTKAYLFIGFIPKNKNLYSFLEKSGYKIIYKPVVESNIRSKPVKGNVDAEIVLYSAKIEFDNYDQAVIISGDGDFYCLHKFLVSKNKLFKIIIPNRHNESSLLNEFQKYKVFLYRERERVELIQNKSGRRRS